MVAERHVPRRTGAASASSGPISTLRVLGLFEALAQLPDGLTLAQLSTVLQSPASSLRLLLFPLAASGYLQLQTGRYRLGPAAFRFAGQIMSVRNFANVIHPFLEELAHRSRESANIGVVDRAAKVLTYIDSVECQQQLRYSVSIGAVRPLHCTAEGRVLLAFADREFQEEYLLTPGLECYTSGTLTSCEGLRAELENVLESSLSVSIGEMSTDYAVVSAPIFGAQGKIIAALSVGWPTARSASRLDELKRLIADIATRASAVAVSEGFTA